MNERLNVRYDFFGESMKGLSSIGVHIDNIALYVGLIVNYHKVLCKTEVGSMT